MRTKWSDGILNIVKGCSYGVLVLIFMILLTAESIMYPMKQAVLLSNKGLLLIGCAILLIVYLIQRKMCWKIRFSKQCGERLFKYKWILFVLLCLLQIYVCYHIYFFTGWDPGYEVLPSAQALAWGMPERADSYYFSMYSNNIMLTLLFSYVLKAGRIFGLGNISDGSGLMLLNGVQCVLSSITGYLICNIVYDETHSYRGSLIAFVFYFVLLGSSPWLVIPYSDSMALIFPVAIFRVYQLLKNKKHILMKWCLIALLSFWGYTIKPQVMIITIAIVIVEGLKLLKESVVQWKSVGKFVICMLLCLGVSQGVYAHLVRTSGLQIDTEYTMGMPHFFMMGLNPNDGGVFSGEDAVFSMGFKTKAERNAADMEVAKERIEEYGVGGLLDHSLRKMLCVYNDGGFAWGCEGSFYLETPPEKDTVISPFLRSLFWNEGTHYRMLLTIRQCAWITLLLLVVCIGAVKKNTEEIVLLLSMLGITLFELLFEARARYLFIYVPMLIILGVIGYQGICIRFGKITKISEVEKE